MKRLKLFKTLLVVAILLVGGANFAWAGALTTMTGIVGPTDNTGAFAANHSKEVTLAAGDSYSYTFVNYNKGVGGTNEWETWIAECKKSDAALYLTFCSDGRQPWGDLATTKSYTGSVWTDISSTKNVFLQAYNGVTVNFTVSRSVDGATITMTHTATTNAVADPAIASTTYSGTVTATVNASDEIIFYLMNEASNQNIKRVVHTDASSVTTTYVLRDCASSITAVGTSEYGEDGSAYSSKIRLNSYGAQGGAGAFAFTLDEDWDVSKVVSATLSFYPISKCNKNRSGNILIHQLDAYPSVSSTYTSYSDGKHVVYSHGTSTTKRYTFSTTTLATISASGYDASAPVKGAYYGVDLTSHIQGLSTKSAGDNVYFGIDISDWAADIQIGAYGNDYAPKLEIAYTSATLYTATFTETNSLSPTVTIYSDEDMTSPVTNGALTNGTKYYYKAVLYGYNDVTGNFTVSGANPSINFTMTAKATYNYTVKYKLGTADAVEQEAGTMYVDETKTIYYPICRQDPSQNYYVVSKNNSAPYFGVVISSSNKDVTINYTLDEDIVYYAESENMAGTRYASGQAASYSSNGVSYCSSAATNSYIATNWSVAAGYYDIEVGMANRSYAVNPAPKLMTNSTDESPTVLGGISLSASSYTQKTYLSQQIAAGQNLYIFNDNSSNASKWALDYVILRNSPTSVSKTITSAGWVTYCSPYPLDFSGDIDNLTDVYIITGSKTPGAESGYVSMTSVKGGTVPANTGLLIKGTAGTVTIPVVASSSTDVSGNKLIGVTADTEIAVNTGYVLMNDATNGLGFYKNENAFTVGANTAYLPADFVGSISARFFLLFDDEATGINMVHGEGFKVNGSVYNLNGQRIDNPTKGLYIVNGKKVNVR